MRKTIYARKCESEIRFMKNCYLGRLFMCMDKLTRLKQRKTGVFL